MIVSVPLPNDFLLRCQFVDIRAPLRFLATPFPGLPPGCDLDVFDLLLKFLGKRLMGDQQAIAVGQ